MFRPIKQVFFLIVINSFIVLLGGSSLAQNSSSSYYPSAEETANYGPGFPDYCFSNTYSNRSECLKFSNQPVTTPLATTPPPPGLQRGCSVVGAGKVSCIGPVGHKPVAPDLESCVVDSSGRYLCGALQQSQPIYPLPALPLPAPQLPAPPYQHTIDDFRFEPSKPVPDCQYGYLPRCQPITTAKHFEQPYRSGPAIPPYYIGESLSFQIRSYYTGYLYVFVTEADQSTKMLYPNPYSNTTHLNRGEVANFPEADATYNLEIVAPYGRHKLFFVILNNYVPRETFEGVHSEHRLNEILLELGLYEDIYHGYGETYFDVAY